jgi:hypothetical protein
VIDSPRFLKIVSKLALSFRDAMKLHRLFDTIAQDSATGQRQAWDG